MDIQGNILDMSTGLNLVEKRLQRSQKKMVPDKGCLWGGDESGHDDALILTITAALDKMVHD